jgi:ribose transport system ATP-binding protein
LSRRQVVEIAKALGKKPQLLILDEATSALTSADVEKVYAMLARLKAEGVAILYISHRMHEVEALADRASVFRNGRHIETFDKGRRSTAEIVQLMIGRDIATQYPAKPARSSVKPMLALENLSWEGRLDRISLRVGAGEIVGLGGLDGQGQKSLLLALFGVLRGVSGRVSVEGRVVRPGSPAAAKSVGIALVPEDRKTEGLMLPMSIADNLVIASLDAISTGPLVDRARESDAVKRAIARLQIKIGAPGDAVSTLSGGNQQKVALSRWLLTKPTLLILDEPTQGIDVGAKSEIHSLMCQLAEDGVAILMISSELLEILGMSDRIAVMHGGTIVGVLDRSEATPERVLARALGQQTSEFKTLVAAGGGAVLR